jgi:8-oxo-dGTP pyrophosphatase MutT (NUDIX family)
VSNLRSVILWGSGVVKGERLRHMGEVTFSALQADLEARLRGASPSLGDLGRLRELLAGSPTEQAPFLRTHMNPGHCTASAFVLSPSGDELLLILHRKLGLWLQPGGHLEEGDESFEGAARRELEEECGVTQVKLVDPWIDFDVHTIPAYGALAEHLHFDLRVLLQATDYTLGGSSEVLAARWFPLAQLMEPGALLGSERGTDLSVIRVARRLVGSPRARQMEN